MKCLKYFVVLLSLVLSLPALSVTLPLRNEIYAENAYLGRENQATLLGRGRLGLEVLPSLTAFLQAGTELQTAGPTAPTLDPGGSFVYAGPGTRYSWGPVSLTAELRARHFFYLRPNAANPQHTLDARLVGATGTLWERPLLPAWYLFVEPYAEVVYTSADHDNVVASGHVRPGLRWKSSDRLLWDLYLETYGAVDRVRHFFNNRVDLKPSVRFQYLASGVSLSLMASYVFNSYLRRGDYEPNPYANVSSGFRLLTVVGANF